MKHAVMAEAQPTGLPGLRADSVVVPGNVVAEELTATPGVVGDFCELIKARLTSLVLVTTLAGFYLGSEKGVSYLRMFNTLLGTALVAAGAAALNEFIERHVDARMKRTRDRPLPSGRMQPDTALLIGVSLAVGGMVYLDLLVNAASSMLAALTLATYVFAYTPLKRITSLNTLVGAIPGALPPVIGWAAARDQAGAEAWVLFAILFCWQMPHFLAIAWMYREDYAQAGFVMLPNVDREGGGTGRQAVNYAGALLMVSLLPTLVGMANPVYFAGAFLLGVGMVVYAWRMQRDATRLHARQLFFASIIYLPLLLGLLAVCKVVNA